MNLSIHKKFQLYNTLFLGLNYKGANDYGYLIPILGTVAKQKLEEGLDPIQIYNQFYDDYREIIGIDKIDFMFKVIQYVERQIVLFDSIEDSVSPYETEAQNSILIDTLTARCKNQSEMDELMNKLNEFSVRIVLTAHPTQFYRPAVLDIISSLRKLVSKNKIEEIDHLLHQLGLTSLVNSKSPTPIEEAKNIIHICRYEYYHAIGEFVYNLEKKYPHFSNNQLVALGFWPCGDRDGNPYVNYKVTSEVIDTLRMTLMKCYYNDIKDLKTKLTFRNIDTEIADIQNKLYDAMFDENVLVDYTWLNNSLEKIRTLLISRYESLFLEDLDKFMVKVRVFKNHFASLDIRQDHSIHLECIEEILIKNGIIKASIKELDKSKLISLLTDEFVDIPDDSILNEIVLDTVKNIEQLPELQKMNGIQGCHRYIISNSEDIYSVLFVFGLFRWIHKTNAFSFDIVPLFETMKGMDASEQVMIELYKLKSYNKHLQNRNKKQTIMLGFSDGTKDGGYLKANWSIYKCKEVLATISKRYDILPVFFDGRGGPPARGGGKTFNFYAARSPIMANNDIQLTIQGQTITSTYGTREKFNFNAEQMITSGLSSLDPNSNSEISESQRDLLEELSTLSYNKYIALKEDPKFLPYLEQLTTLKFYSETNIGSRPGRRNKSSKLSLKDLRAISYVGSWSQIKQNIPGYYGVGTAIKELSEKGKMHEVQKLYNEVPFFKTLIDNSMMSLTKCFFALTSYIRSNEEFSAFWNMLYDEFELSTRMILEISQMDTLMDNEKSSKESILVRNELVQPLLLIQHYALQMLNSGYEPENKAVFEKIVVRSLYGNINASRNSA